MSDTEMVEEQTPETVEQDSPEVEETAEEFDEARAMELINKLRKREKDADKAEKKLAQLEAEEEKRKEAELSELEKANKHNEELRAKLEAVTLREMRGRIGAKFELPAEIADLLQGDDEDAMEQHAAKLKAALPTPAAINATNHKNGPVNKTAAQMRAFLNGGEYQP